MASITCVWVLGSDSQKYIEPRVESGLLGLGTSFDELRTPGVSHPRFRFRTYPVCVHHREIAGCSQLIKG